MISTNLLNRTIDHHKLCNQEFIVKPSLPILYFGDLNKYFKSEIKIVTVALNPSDMEFKKHKSDKNYSFHRFPLWDPKKNNLIEALNTYYHKDKNPYYEWFDKSFEPLLNGINASYYNHKNFSNRALHTDLCSPLATNPTWTKLSKYFPNDVKNLTKIGREIWRDLINEIEPDVILISLKKEVVEKEFGNFEENEVFWSSKIDANKRGYHDLRADDKPRKNPYLIYKKELELKTVKISNIFYGRANQLPFMELDFSSKRKPRVRAGECINEYIITNSK